MAKAKTVDEYIEELGDWRGEVVAALRAVVIKAAPKAEEAIKWAQPVYSSQGPICFIKAHTGHVNFGFWRGTEVDDPGGRLEGSGDKMRHVKLSSVKDIRKGELGKMVRSAVKLNADKGDPTRRKK